MRRVALVAAAAALLVVVAVAFGAGGSVTRATAPPPTLKPSDEKSVSERERGQELLGYWGKLAPLSGPGLSGYYQAKCVGLTGTTDGRIVCDIVVNLGNGSTGGTLILQGLVKRPTPPHGLFAVASDIQLAVTGGGGGYSGRRGSAEIRGTTAGLVISLMP
jgi:hypothetical protein